MLLSAPTAAGVTPPTSDRARPPSSQSRRCRLIFAAHFNETRQDLDVSEPEEPLVGGNLNSAVVRVGDTVHRASGAWTPAVHALLEHLAGVGYPAPRPMGIDEQ